MRKNKKEVSSGNLFFFFIYKMQITLQRQRALHQP
jgi:hypothetical protein